jgi:hypothetical protein
MLNPYLLREGDDGLLLLLGDGLLLVEPSAVCFKNKDPDRDIPLPVIVCARGSGVVPGGGGEDVPGGGVPLYFLDTSSISSSGARFDEFEGIHNFAITFVLFHQLLADFRTM